jgi:hypothetical protein
MMDQYEKLSLCGLYCGGCKNYKENYNCMGCRNEKELVDDCPTRACCIDKGLLHCGLCEDFPCGILNDFYTDGMKHHELAFKNMLDIKERGAEQWLNDQEEAHTCICGRKKVWFETNCVDEACKIT